MSKISSLCKRLFAVGITALSLQAVFPIEESSACSVHDHNCQFHGIGRAVNPNIIPGSGTAAYIITESVDPTNTLDFDSNVLLQNGFGPYVVSATGFPTTPGQPYIGPGDNPRHVYPGQYQIDFNANTAQARHSGDLNGLEVVPGATGCEYSTAANCEEIKIVGNIPDTGDGVGFVVRQRSHLYNAQNTTNPAIDTQTYAVATGRAFIRTFNHAAHGEPALFGHNYDTDSLSGPRDQPASLGNENTYYIGYSDFDPHAVGASLWWNQRWQTSGNAYRVSGQHWYQDNLYKNVTTHKQKRFISGMGDESYGDYGKSTRQVFIGTAPSQAYYDHQRKLEKQRRLARIAEKQEAKRLADEKALEDAKIQADYDRGCRSSNCNNINEITALGITLDRNPKPIEDNSIVIQPDAWASTMPDYNNPVTGQGSLMTENCNYIESGCNEYKNTSIAKVNNKVGFELVDIDKNGYQIPGATILGGESQLGANGYVSNGGFSVTVSGDTGAYLIKSDTGEKSVYNGDYGSISVALNGELLSYTAETNLEFEASKDSIGADAKLEGGVYTSKTTVVSSYTNNFDIPFSDNQLLVTGTYSPYIATGVGGEIGAGFDKEPNKITVNTKLGATIGAGMGQDTKIEAEIITIDDENYTY